jgi:hypothetical protein
VFTLDAAEWIEDVDAERGFGCCERGGARFCDMLPKFGVELAAEIVVGSGIKPGKWFCN